ncbi:TIGR02530 family flagellar biosynthesis protein [Natronincola ferrireducens]|uniref:Flagellar operon protein n=1 Tax=Natronincola ferrireducens TaxID=393762 RepID=A0A1G9C1A1_9FIRM|nr:TIGR02530 family flagellar biosynthesis protein [Natronincola ferrireducens]SDK45466.1 flagellar operon protein [Natronincola ferrireducens]
MVTYKINNKHLISQNNLQKPNSIKGTSDFHQVFQQQINKSAEIKFSKHAIQRLQQRNIELSVQEISKLNNAIDTAAKKGIKETLIIMDNRAFIASVNNKTVITAAVDEQLEDNVFTNIDGAVII